MEFFNHTGPFPLKLNPFNMKQSGNVGFFEIFIMKVNKLCWYNLYACPKVLKKIQLGGYNGCGGYGANMLFAIAISRGRKTRYRTVTCCVYKPYTTHRKKIHF